MTMRQTGKAVQQHMGAAEGIFHGVMICFTCGLWYFVYRHRKNELHRTTNIYTGS